MFSPLAGSRVKQTPVAELSPLLPNTMAWMLTAVPHSTGMLLRRRYRSARSLRHDWNTALMAPSSCVYGSSGKLMPRRFLISALNSATSSFSASAGSSESSLTPRAFFLASSSSSNGS